MTPGMKLELRAVTVHIRTRTGDIEIRLEQKDGEKEKYWVTNCMRCGLMTDPSQQGIPIPLHRPNCSMLTSTDHQRLTRLEDEIYQLRSEMIELKKTYQSLRDIKVGIRRI